MMREMLIKDELSPEDEHIHHCFNYIRQSLMCNIDLQLHTRGGPELLGTVDQTHVCRDYSALVRWIDANRWEEFWDWHFEHGVLG